MKARKPIYVFHLFLFSICLPVLADEGDFSVSVSEDDSVVEEPSPGELVKYKAQNSGAQEEKARHQASQGGVDEDESVEEPSPGEFVKLMKQGRDSMEESEVLQSLRIDLDQDGRMDSVRILREKGEFNRLEIKLAKDRKKFVFRKLVEKTYEDKVAEGAKDAYECIGATSNLLKKGIGNSLKLEMKHGDYDGCHDESGKHLNIKYVNGELRVEKAFLYDKHFSAGDPSPWSEETYDFRRKVSISEYGERHTGEHHQKMKKLSPKCEAPTLKEYEKSGLPDCAH